MAYTNNNHELITSLRNFLIAAVVTVNFLENVEDQRCIFLIWDKTGLFL